MSRLGGTQDSKSWGWWFEAPRKISLKKHFKVSVLLFKTWINNSKRTCNEKALSLFKIIIFALATLSLIYCKSFLLPCYLLFALEYFYICKYLNTIYAKKTEVYKVIKIKKLNYLPQSTFAVWKEICKINAFLKVYKIFYKKKINF
jgi:hypothetical protein